MWIGYEPWGWVPYHYGRWVHHGRAGWCWVPPRHRDVRWEPAHVAWVNSSRQIGWVPLAPGERYDRRTAPVIRQTNVYNVTYNNVTIERSAAAARTSYRNACGYELDGHRRTRPDAQPENDECRGGAERRGNNEKGRPARKYHPRACPGRPRPQCRPTDGPVSGRTRISPGSGTNSSRSRELRACRLRNDTPAFRPQGARAWDTQVQKVPCAPLRPTVTPLRERMQAMKTPATKPDTKPAVQPKEIGNRQMFKHGGIFLEPATPCVPPKRQCSR